MYANLIEGKTVTTDNRPVPYAVFTDPQLGRVGMTNARCARRAKAQDRQDSDVVGSPRRSKRDETAGLMKIVVDAESDRILGAAILGVGRW